MKIFHLACMILLLAAVCACSNQSDLVKKHTLKISILQDPISLDPRLARDLASASVLTMLFEGLVTTDEQGNIIPSLAESYQISEDGKTYTFKLRESVWSDGNPVTAEDFEKSWKSVLEPSFPSPNAHQFYFIKNGKKAKQGELPIDTVGIHAVSPDTLIVELEAPLPYFLKLVASYYYLPASPVQSASKEEKPFDARTFVSNGPFCLTEWQRRKELVFAPNSRYWNKEIVRLEEIQMLVLEENTSLQLLLSGEIDWIGSPLSLLPPDGTPLLKEKHLYHSTPSLAVQWLYCNVEASPINHPLVRKALSQAIDRENIVKHILAGGEAAAYHSVPRSLQLPEPPSNNEMTQARETLAIALQELGLPELPMITLSYFATQRSSSIVQALQEQWSKNLGIEVKLANSELKVLIDKTLQKDYQLALLSWYGDIADPINFLDIFKKGQTASKRTGWEDPRFDQLVDQSDRENDQQKRENALVEANQLISNELPVIPLFNPVYQYAKNPKVVGVRINPLGYLDFRNGYIRD